LVVTVDQLTPEEPLSPELVLVLPPELRAQALAGLCPPVWPKARPRVAAAPPLAQESLTRTFGAVLVARVAQLVLIFVAVAALTLMLSPVANAVR
jgi:hypothetical protein